MRRLALTFAVLLLPALGRAEPPRATAALQMHTVPRQAPTRPAPEPPRPIEARRVVAPTRAVEPRVKLETPAKEPEAFREVTGPTGKSFVRAPDGKLWTLVSTRRVSAKDLPPEGAGRLTGPTGKAFYRAPDGTLYQPMDMKRDRLHPNDLPPSAETPSFTPITGPTGRPFVRGPDGSLWMPTTGRDRVRPADLPPIQLPGHTTPGVTKGRTGMTFYRAADGTLYRPRDAKSDAVPASELPPEP
jgi:hypothetical protein